MNRVVFHCFSEGPEELKRLKETGARASFTGIITYKNAQPVRDALIEQGLDNLIEIVHGNFKDIPFEDGSFDLAWALNVTMNIEDRAGLYAEIHRVLKPSGKIGISEIGQGPGGEPYYPLTWAREPAYSFLLPPDEMRSLMEASGFRIVEWLDETARRQASAAGRPSDTPAVETPLTIEMTRGSDYPDRRKNSGRNVKENRLTKIVLVAEKI